MTVAKMENKGGVAEMKRMETRKPLSEPWKGGVRNESSQTGGESGEGSMTWGLFRGRRHEFATHQTESTRGK